MTTPLAAATYSIFVAKQNWPPCGSEEPLLATVKRWKVACFGPFTHQHNVYKTVSQGALEGGGGDAVVGNAEETLGG